MDKRQYLLICLMEECAEVQKMASKTLRFGPDACHPEGAVSNIEELRRECNDLVAVMDLLMKDGTLPDCVNSEKVRIKQDKVLHYMGVSSSLGILDPSDTPADYVIRACYDHYENPVQSRLAEDCDSCNFMQRCIMLQKGRV